MNEFTHTPTVENPHAVSVNLCPDCGTPPQLTIYSDGPVDCFCSDFKCKSYDVLDASSWQAALQQWNENTAKAYAERSESPISTPSDCEPAEAESEPQDGSECVDTREKLEAWAHEEIAEKWARSDEDVLQLFTDLYDLMDMQAAITRADYSVHLPQRVAELMGQLDSLTAERDDLRERLQVQANSFQKLERENARLRDKLERVREMVGGDAE